MDEKRTYSACAGGQRAWPPEDCGGPLAFIESRDEVPWEAQELLWRIVDDLNAGDLIPLANSYSDGGAECL
jgi:hypothetical protein